MSSVPREALLLFLADSLLVFHALFVVFVVVGLALVYVGYFLAWSWIRNRVFRALHLLAIGIVVVQSWLGVTCPLTTWEMALREAAGAGVYSGSFVQHWLDFLLYYRAPEWVFIALYTGFGTLVLASWYFVPPSSKLPGKEQD